MQRHKMPECRPVGEQQTHRKDRPISTERTDGDAHSVRTQVTETQDALAVREHDHL